MNSTNFITREDYPSSIRTEFIERVTREDENILEIVENQAIAEMKGYLSGRYDCEKAFGATGDDRHNLLLMFAKDIAIYHLCSIREGLMTQTRIDRYERAVEWLKGVKSGDVTVEGLDRVGEEQGAPSSEFQMRSDSKRTNHF